MLVRQPEGKYQQSPAASDGRVRRHLGPHAVTTTQLAFLIRGRQASIDELAREVGVDPGNLEDEVERLVTAGILADRRSATDPNSKAPLHGVEADWDFPQGIDRDG
jgi:predicted transcriptional regulator